MLLPKAITNKASNPENLPTNWINSFVTFGEFFSSSASCFLFVSAQLRPKILEHPADAIAAKEEPLTLNCKATGRPQPEISWYHNGTPLVPSERRVILPEGSLFFLR